jgi:hypothetical protein
MHKEIFIINCKTLLHVSTPLGYLQGELFVIVTLGCTLYLSENVLFSVHCVVFGGVNSSRSRPDGSSSGRTFCYRYTRLHFIVGSECAVDCVLRCFWGRELPAVPACRPGPRTVHPTSTQSTAHSH